MSRHRSKPPADWLPSSDQDGYAMPDYSPPPDYQPGPEYPEAPGYPGYPPADGFPAISHDEYGVVPEPAGDGLRQAREPGHAAPDAAGPGQSPRSDGDPGSRSDGAAARWAMLGYLTVPLFGFVVPLLVYLRNLHGANWSRAHAAQALNVWITAVLYSLSAVIMGTMLALDSPQIALLVFGPLVAVLWLVMLTYLVRAATAASQGQEYAFPGWLCSRIVR